MTDTKRHQRPSDESLRAATMYQTLHWLAADRITPTELTEVHLQAALRRNDGLNAFVEIHAELVREQAAAAVKRRKGGVLGRLDGIPVAIKDNLDVAGIPTRVGMPGRDQSVPEIDSHAVSRLRSSGAVLLGKTRLDEGALGTTTNNPHDGPVQNPFRAGYTAGGSSGGSAAAVAAGLVAAAIGSDTLGSVRIPASYCGLCAIKPTHGEISTRGLVPAARRLDAIGILARSVEDLSLLLQVMTGFDADDPRSRKRRVALSTPDWEPGRLCTGILQGLAEKGVEAEVAALFEQAMHRLENELGEREEVDFSDWDFAAHRRCGLLLMEAEMCLTFAEDLANRERPVSDDFRAMLEYAAGRSAVDYVAADQVLDAATLKARRLFSRVDVLVMPTTPQGAFPLDAPVPSSQADLTSFANLAGCPSVSIPMGMLAGGLPVGMQFVGPPGSDLRLLELAAACAASLDATPNFPLD